MLGNSVFLFVTMLCAGLDELPRNASQLGEQLHHNGNVECLYQGALLLLDEHDTPAKARQWLQYVETYQEHPLAMKAARVRQGLTKNLVPQVGDALLQIEESLEARNYDRAQRLLDELPASLDQGTNAVAEGFRKQLRLQKRHKVFGSGAAALALIGMVLLIVWRQRQGGGWRPVPLEVWFLTGVAVLFIPIAFSGPVQLAWVIAEVLLVAIVSSWACAKIERGRWGALVTAVVVILSACYASLYWHDLLDWFTQGIRYR